MTFGCICNYNENMNKLFPSPLDLHLGYWLRCLSNSVSGAFAARVERHGVSVAQWVVLRTLYDHDDVSLVKTAELVGVDKSSLSRMTERLIAKKLLVRTESPEDGRAMLLRLSSAGKKLVPVLAQEADKNDHFFFKTLTARQKEQFLQTIQNLLKANGWDSHTHGKDRMA